MDILLLYATKGLFKGFKCLRFGSILSVLGFFIISGCSATPTATARIPAQSTKPTGVILPSAIPTNTPTSTPAPTSTPTCDQIEGSMEFTSYTGIVNEDEIPVIVYLPPCYGRFEHTYPVLYALHGYPLDETHWLDLGIIEVVEGGYASERWPHFLIVLPFIPQALNIHTDGGDGSYEQEFIEGLHQNTIKKYQVRSGAEFTALAGVSRGAVWSLEIGLRNSELIGIVASLSPALHVNNPRPAYDPFQLIRESADLPDRIFLSVGTEEGGFHDKTVEFVELLTSLDIQHTYHETGGAHENSTWIGIMDDVIAFITMEW